MNQILFYIFLILVLFTYSLSAQNIKCDKNSNELELFIKSLKNQNYKITNSINSKDEIIFYSNQSNQLQFNNVKYYQVKCKKVLKDNMFVRFNIYEICFNNAEQSIFYENKINKIINGNDIYNEKLYDFVVRNKNQLIYISTNARVFYESVLEHKNELVKIIEK